jgi:hypothetical protein
MSRRDEQLWREVFDRRGRVWAEQALNGRRGQPGDAVIDVVFVEPYPTRKFVRRWRL